SPDGPAWQAGCGRARGDVLERALRGSVYLLVGRSAHRAQPLSAAPAGRVAGGPMEHTITRASDERVNVRSSIPFFLLQLLPLLAFVTGVTTTALVLLAVTFFGRMFFITAGYHRYFAHRSYKLGRVA